MKQDEKKLRLWQDRLTAAENARFSSVDWERSSVRMRAGSMPMDTSVSRMHRASVSGSRSFCPPEATHTASG